MRVDHFAYRVDNRGDAAHFLCMAFDYEIEEDFLIEFGNGDIALSYALKPRTLRHNDSILHRTESIGGITLNYEYHSPPEIFVSEGSTGSIVDKWVKENGNGLHHLAYEVEDVASEMEKWQKNGWVEFTTNGPIEGPDGLIQCFTQPHAFTGVIYEFINRGWGKRGFNKDSVKKLMESTI